MRAAVLVGSNQPLVLADLQIPPLQVGQVLVKIHFAGICGAQIGEIAATKGVDKFLPHLLGHEAVGTVIEIGAGVTTKAVGDHAICHWRPSEGIAAQGPVYDWNGQAVNAGPMACFAESCIVSENRLTLLPDGINLKVAPLFGCSLTTAYGVCTNDVQIRPGDQVLVIGAGGVGLAIIQMAALLSADVFAVDPATSKHALALQCGADAVMHSVDQFLGECDAVIETTGRADMIAEAYELTKTKGTTVLVGVPRHDDPITIHSLPLHFGKVLTGSEGGSCVPHEDIPRLAKLVRAGKLKLDGLVTHEFPLEQINEALAVVRSGTAGRVLLRMNG